MSARSDEVEALEALAGADQFAEDRTMVSRDWTLELPSAPDEERAVLGAMLLSDTEAAQIAAALEPKDFYDGQHFALFRTLCERLKDGRPIDGVSLTTQGVIDQNTFAGLVDKAVEAGATVSGAWVPHAQALRQVRTRRGLIWTARRLIDQASRPDCDVPATLADAQNALSAAQRLNLSAQTSPEALLDGFEQTVRGWTGLPLAKSGIGCLDTAIGGGVLPKEILAIIGGEGSMKTSLALRFAEEYLKSVGKPVLYLSLDMPPEQIALRRLLPLAETGEKSLTAAIQDHPEAFAQVRARRAELDAGRFHIIGGPMRLADIESLVSRLSPGMVIWDYLTATAGYKSEMDAQRACVEALRAWQKRYSVTWVVLSQMSEIAKAGQRQGDFAGRASGGNNLARVAHYSLELFRDEAEPEKYQMQMNITPKPRLICTVSKCRQGIPGSSWDLDYDGPTMSFTGAAERVRREKKRKAMFTRE